MPRLSVTAPPWRALASVPITLTVAPISGSPDSESVTFPLNDPVCASSAPVVASIMKKRINAVRTRSNARAGFITVSGMKLFGSTRQECLMNIREGRERAVVKRGCRV